MRALGAVPCLLLAAACGGPAEPPVAKKAAPEAEALERQARAFVERSDAEVRGLFVTAFQAAWTNQTDITPEHEAAEAKAMEALSVGITRLNREARAFDPAKDRLDEDTRRKLQLLRFADQPAPQDPARASELARLSTQMNSVYAKGKACEVSGGRCRDLDALSKVLQESRRPAQLRAAWEGWHDAVGKAERPLFERFVALANEGARDVGFRDVAEMWRGGYDMPEDAFEAEVDRLWGQVKPLYTQLHCHMRRSLHRAHGASEQPATGPIRAHLTGNMWSLAWTYRFRELEPFKGVAPVDSTPALARKHDEKGMVRIAEGFFTSLGFPPLPETFWQRSMFVKPRGKAALCHASAWDVTFDADLRLKMCIVRNQEDLLTIHHELGHLYYFNEYRALPVAYQQGANDGFHEAVGDAVALSMTPGYLHAIGLLPSVERNERATINRQMDVALDKVAFLPYGLLVDKWRWDVFAGRVRPADYNRHWWDLVLRYQGIEPPSPRVDPALFDPGAKSHVAGNTPYMRYFLASILQFQFHRALCRQAGFAGPLHECSIHGNRAAGDALRRMLALGASKPWPEALFALTGERAMDAGAMLEYFAPLSAWLAARNEGETCGW